MMELLTAAQMRAIEQAAIESGEVTGLELMERAGRGVVEAVFKEWPELARLDHRAVVLCGPGNNGGDGFVVARLLHEWGWQVEVFLYGEVDNLPTDARVNYERWLELGEVSNLAPPISSLKDSHIIIDALFGIGLSRELEGKSAQAVELLATWNSKHPNDDITVLKQKTISVDMPSGICTESGCVIGKNYIAVAAHLTVTFHSEKLGHHQYLGPSHCGKLVKIDIGLGERHAYRSKNILNSLQLINQVENDLTKTILHHKYNHGHAYIFSGKSTKTGAARLASRGALRIGAGLVTIGAPKDAMAEHAAQLNATMLSEVNHAVDFDMIIKDKRINAFCIGPAFGLSQDRIDLLAVVLKAKRATVLDADALTLISMHPELMKLLHNDCVLTPHDGEFARVFPDISEKLNAIPTKGPAYSKVDATQAAAKRAGCVVLFKGSDTVIAGPDLRCSINSAHYERSAPWLATAGSGDVLAGFITGLLARGYKPMEAAKTAAWLHVECAVNFGPGLIAEDLPEQLPEVFRKLGV